LLFNLPVHLPWSTTHLKSQSHFLNEPLEKQVWLAPLKLQTHPYRPNALQHPDR